MLSPIKEDGKEKGGEYDGNCFSLFQKFIIQKIMAINFIDSEKVIIIGKYDDCGQAKALYYAEKKSKVVIPY
ncbi:MAG: hypothetical protein J7L31_06115 [Thermoplasmata archaeon]|nr:hypothetical protein [Thermoplasmata archaeon]